MARLGGLRGVHIGTWPQRGAPLSPLRKQAIHNWATCFYIACRGVDAPFIVHAARRSFSLFSEWMFHLAPVAVDRLRDHDHQTASSGHGPFYAHGH